MSVFTNPASGGPEDTRAYVKAVLELVVDSDPLEILRTSPAWFLESLQGLSSAQLQQPEAAGKWSIGQVIQHLADSEIVWSYRVRRILAEERPLLQGYDQDAWARRLGYDDVSLPEALGVFGALRAANLRLLRSATPDDLARVGVHEERGEESVAHLIALYAGHDLLHRRQVERIRTLVA
ncbi:MAG: DinB family protein [Gemmatimonadota bacterium]